MSEGPRNPLRRISVARTGILLAVVLLAMLSFGPWLGPARLLFRGVLILGVLALAASWFWPWVRRFRSSLRGTREEPGDKH